jgi:serine/threonine-protein kinase
MSGDWSDLASRLADRYVIERELGAGGMATVYLAHDLKHDRDVAIKVLHPDLGAALGAERFLSEIKTTAKLQHPHILPLLDSGEAGGMLYYAMPVVTGESLRARLDRERQLPIADAVRIAREVAGALDYAHRHGVIHRDIKPENILLHDGQALVADFGIALAVQTAGGARMTQTGLSLGTPQYMSPEQAMGERTIDARSDIYALGAMTYEMLAGDPPFTGSSVQAIVAKIISEKPTALHTLRDTVPPAVEHAVLTALAKLPADRYATAAEFAAALTSAAVVPTAWRDASSRRRSPAVAVLAAALVASVAVAAWGWLRPAAPAGPVTRVAVSLPQGQAIEPAFWGFSFDLSHDGRRLAYVGPGPTKGTSQIWLRALDALDASAVAGTTGAIGVQWSPDGRSLLVMTSRPNSRVVSVDGGQVVSMRDVWDASWGPDGRIYSDSKDANIVRRTVGGVPDTVFRGDTGFVLGHPMALPNGRGVLFVRVPKPRGEATRSEIVGVSFGSPELTIVGLGVWARVLASGKLLYASAEGTMFIAPFDQSSFKITGPAVPLARVAMGANAGRSYPAISVADDGTFAYLAGNLQQQRLTWLDPTGRVASRLPIEGDIWGIALSPDATRLAYTLRADSRDPRAASRGTGDVWTVDLTTGASTRLTSEWFSPRPSWSPDGKSVLYARIGGPENQGLYERRADASEPEHLVLSMKQFGHSVGDGRWLPDHETLIVRTYADDPCPQCGNGSSASLANLYSATAGSRGTPFIVNSATKVIGVPSPDGALVAYISDETGIDELYVQRFPSGGERLLVSKGGGSPPRWSRDGRTLWFFDQRGMLMVATIASRPALAVTSSREIRTDITPIGARGGRSNHTFDVAPDGRIIVTEDVPGAFDLILVRNGMTDLGKAPKI